MKIFIGGFPQSTLLNTENWLLRTPQGLGIDNKTTLAPNLPFIIKSKRDGEGLSARKVLCGKYPFYLSEEIVL